MQEELNNNDVSRFPLCDIYVVFHIIIMAVFIFPGWLLNGSYEYGDIVTLLVPLELSAIVGFMLVLRTGTLDLSVWAVMGLGGAVAASMINKGYSPLISVLCALGCGAFVGAINGILTSLIPLKKPLAGIAVTLATGIGIILICGWIFTNDRISLELGDFDPFAQWINDFVYGGIEGDLEIPPLYMGRVMLTFCSWAVVLMFLMTADLIPPLSRFKESPLPAMAVSGLFAALSGVCWLMESSVTPVPTRLIDSMYIPAVVVLAGGMILRGQGRTMLAGMFLPVSAMLVRLWEMIAWPKDVYGYSISLIVLLLLLVGGQVSFRKIRQGRKFRIFTLLQCVLFFLGLMIIVVSGVRSWPTPRGLLVCGGLSGLAAVIIMVVNAVVCRAGKVRTGAVSDDCPTEA